MDPPPMRIPAGPERTRSRGYQMEMLNESLKRNIIVTMDTGSGKTHIAVLRIRSYLESGEGKLCWLLVPSVPLGAQQFEVLKESLPPVNIQFLSGSDNVDKWKTQEIWDGVLKLQERTSTVVVSTHQILLDALTHGFLSIDMIGLLIYDEAHHCFGNHPANRIMEDFYHPSHHHSVPSILGLTASPIVKSKPEQLRVIESNLDAISRTPILNRDELMQFVHAPVMRNTTYKAAPSLGRVLEMKVADEMWWEGVGDKRGLSPGSEDLRGPAMAKLKISETESVDVGRKPGRSEWSTPALRSLMRAYSSMDINDDPRVLQLRATRPPDLDRIQETIEHKRTRSQHQMRGIVSKATHILTEYGIWATEWYIKMIVERALEAMEEESQSDVLAGWDEQEKAYFGGVLGGIEVGMESRDVRWGITDKVEQVIALLIAEFNGEGGGNEFSGLVFVEQRVGVTVLAEILRMHPETREIFEVGTLVGTSDHSAKTGRLVFELVSLREQKGTIDDFRKRAKNIVISTSVVEEGLDIPACNLVVCFSLPQNVKSFIQRRGRARREKSTYYLMFEEGSGTQEKIGELERLEREMIREYMDETRELEKRLEIEEGEADEDGVISDEENRKFLVRGTDALLTLGSAISHLHHFCDTLPYAEYTDPRPIFTITAVSPGGGGFFQVGKTHYRAEVLLPNSVPQSVRWARGKRSWASKRWARRDAAFEAYLGLYKLEDPLINDHLLPLASAMKEARGAPEARPTTRVEKTMDPWAGMGWTESTVIYATPITLHMPNTDPVGLNLLTMMECPYVDKIPIHWTKSEIGEVTVGRSRCLGVDESILERAKRMTYELLNTVHAEYMQDGVVDFPYLFFWGDNGTPAWDEGGDRSSSAYDAYKKGDFPLNDIGIIREASQQYIFSRWRNDISPSGHSGIIRKYNGRPFDPDQPIIELHRLQYHRNFLQQPVKESTVATVHRLPQYCTIDKVPWRYSQFAMFVPGIIHTIGTALIASNIQNTLLSTVGFRSVSSILTALSTSSAKELHDYQRLEFLGDSVLKLLVSVNLFDEHPSWHEGMLSVGKERVMSNASLAKAAQEKGLARWIISEKFAGVDWSPQYITSGHEFCEKGGEPRDLHIPERVLSTKALVDVVKALIGVAYDEGGYEQALKCIIAFDLDLTWKPLPERASSLFQKAATAPPIDVSYLRGLQELLGYEFKKLSILLEAITHTSSELPSPSYQRLEFLGDALLDMLVIDQLFFDPTHLLPADMQLYKSSVVSGNFLAFLSMGCSASEEIPRVEGFGDSQFQVRCQERRTIIWDYVHFSHPEMIKAKRNFLDYNKDSRTQIQSLLDTGTHYPWAEISPLDAGTTGKCKVFADIFEAIFGAVFVDSMGDFGAIKRLAERFGIGAVLRRFMKDKVNVMHPFNRFGEAATRLGKGPVIYYDSVEQGLYVHTVSVGGRELATAKSRCKVQSKVLAAEMSLEILEREAKDEEEMIRERAQAELFAQERDDIDMRLKSTL